MASDMLAQALTNSWRRPNLLTVILLPLSLLYAIGLYVNKGLFALGLKQRRSGSLPTIVVGNLSVGGTGKTPLVIHLVQLLQEQGLRPGVISRGFASSSEQSGDADKARLAVEEADVHQAGDEPCLIHRRTGVPVMVCRKRHTAIDALKNRGDIDVVISDDGLQHWALKADIEICIDDPAQTKRNPFLLPAGPWRESKRRRKSIDFLIEHSLETGVQQNGGYQMSLTIGKPVPLLGHSDQWDASKTIHAVAGIGHPQRFFNTCKEQGWQIEEHAFPDHHQFRYADIDFGNAPVIMTEKDAVKCMEFANQHHWYLPVTARLNKEFDQAVLVSIKKCIEISV